MTRSIALAYAITGLAVATAIGAIVAAATGTFSPREPDSAAALEAPAPPRAVTAPAEVEDGSAIVVVERRRKRRSHSEHEQREHRRHDEEGDDD